MAKISRVLVELPKDRYKPGRFRVFDWHNDEVASFMCLGKADNHKALKKGNPDRDPTLPYGDTPTGLYGAVRVVKLPEELQGRLGDYWMQLDPEAGDALQAELRGRTGLGVHGGRGNERLVPTFGCVRLFDRDMQEFYEMSQGCRVSLKVIETEES